VRLNKYLAHNSIYSRRKADEIIANGVVIINGVIIKQPWYQVENHDQVVVNGKPVIIRSTANIALWSKPKGVITSTKDEKGRKTIYDVLPATLQSYMYIGRLDYNSEGLLLLTNDSDIKRTFETSNYDRKYKVKAFGRQNPSHIEACLQNPRFFKNLGYKPFKHCHYHNNNNQHRFDITITEGKYREIRNVMAKLGLQVSKLVRYQFAEYTLNDIDQGKGYAMIEGKKAYYKAI
jgi:23S rRNA pseudouridine2605 synthase